MFTRSKVDMKTAVGFAVVGLIMAEVLPPKFNPVAIAHAAILKATSPKVGP